MTDDDKIAQHIASLSLDEEISDACARVIASQWHEGQGSAGYAFVSTGVIVGDEDLWWELGGKEYPHLDAMDKRALDYLGTYLFNRDDRGPVEGWSDLWL